MTKDLDNEKSKTTKSKKDVKEKTTKKDKSKSRKETKDKDNNNNTSIINPEESIIINPENFVINKEDTSDTNEVCDGCYNSLGLVYCSECEFVLCKMCENQIHMIPSNTKHEKFLLSELTHLKKTCYHHKKSLQYYCENCDEPICKDCCKIGPHNNKLHKTVNIIQSFKSKHDHLLSVINNSLSIKVDNLESNLQNIEEISNRIKNNKDNILKEIDNEYNLYLDNIREQEGEKLALVQYNYEDILNDITIMTDIKNYINSIDNSNNPDMTEFLLKYKEMMDTIKTKILNKIPRSHQELEVDPYDYKNLFAINKAKLEKYDDLEKLIQTKDELIWKLLNNNDSNNNEESDEFVFAKQELYDEVQEWSRLSYKYLLELKKFNKVCAFCGIKLDKESVNSNCNKNTEDYYKDKDIIIGGLTIDKKHDNNTANKYLSSKEQYYQVNYCSLTKSIPLHYYRNGFHFFDNPSDDYEEKINKTYYKSHAINKSKEKVTSLKN